MAGPWEKYAAQPLPLPAEASPAQAAGPWSKYTPQIEAALEQAATADLPTAASFAEDTMIAQQRPPRPPEQGMGQRMLEQILLPADIGVSALSSIPGLAVYGGQAFAGLIDSIRRGTYGSSVGGQQMSQRAMEGLQQTIIQPRTQMGQQVMQAAADVAEELKLAPTPVGTALQALARPAAQQAAAAVAPAARQAGTALVETGRQAGTAIAETARRVPEAIAPSPGAEAKPPETIANVFRPGQQRRRAELARIIQEDPYNTEAVRFRLSDGSVKPDTEADQVLKQGWREGAVSVIKAATDKDRDSMLRMLSIYKRGKKNDRYRALNRPADVVGESLQSRVDYIDGQRKEAGQAIDRIADTQLAGQQVEYAPLVDRFVANLNSLGVKVRSDQAGRRFVDLKDSEIQGDTQAETLLNNVLARMSDVTGPPDAKAMHDLKRYLDTQISYGGRPQMNPLTATAERQVKNLRRDINSTLASRFPDYGTENERYSNTLQALSDLQKAAGTSIDFDSPNANKALGTALRKITSNYATRVNLMDALDQTDQVAKKYGMQIDDDIINQTIFANEIDRMFGAVADTSLKGQVAQAAETGLDFARKSNTERALSLVQAGIEKVKGVNEENALKRMEELLKRRSQTTPGTAMVPVE